MARCRPLVCNLTCNSWDSNARMLETFLSARVHQSKVVISLPAYEAMYWPAQPWVILAQFYMGVLIVKDPDYQGCWRWNNPIMGILLVADSKNIQVLIVKDTRIRASHKQEAKLMASTKGLIT